MDTGDAEAERARTLLGVGRPAEALASVNRLLSEQPEHTEGLALMGFCLLELQRVSEAERIWKQATAAHPDNINIAILGVRCAWNDPRQVWARTERLRFLAPNDQNVLYWVALAAARTNHELIAEEAVSRLRAINPVGDQPRLAEAWVDLFNSRRMGRLAKTTERITSELLGENPQNFEAHDLRIKAASLRSDRLGSRRDAAISELRAIGDAASSGVPAEPGRMRALTALTVGAPALGIAFAALAWLGAIGVQAGAIPWPIPVLLMAITWSWLCYAACSRVRLLVRVLPSAGRRRLLKPVVSSTLTTASILGSTGIAALVYLQPYNETRAIEIGFASQIVTLTTVEWVPLPMPLLVDPVPPIPGAPRTLPTVPRTSVPFTLRPGDLPIPTFAPRPTPTIAPTPDPLPPPTFIVQIPRERIETTTTTDPATALALIRYWIVIAALAVGAGGGLLLVAHLAHRGRHHRPR